MTICQPRNAGKEEGNRGILFWLLYLSQMSFYQPELKTHRVGMQYLIYCVCVCVCVCVCERDREGGEKQNPL